MDKIEPTFEEARNNLLRELDKVLHLRKIIDWLAWIIICITTMQLSKSERFKFGYGKMWYDGWNYDVYCGFFCINWSY